MAKHLRPVAVPPLLITEFLDYVLQHHQTPTTLIICSTREASLQELSTSITHHSSDQDSTTDPTPSPQHLLHQTIHLIAISRTVTVAFAPTVPHLRAYLATYSYRTKPSDSEANQGVNSSSQKPMLAIWNLAALHRSTTEYSAQGLSRTLAVAVESAHLAGQQLVLAESRERFDDFGEREGRRVGLEPWREEVPLLSGSVRFGGEGSGLGGRMVEVGDVVRRWCRILRVEGVGADS